MIKMKLQKQPNRWSCLPTAFATIADIPVDELITEIGHDGSEIIDSTRKDPFCRRSFHVQEIIDVLLERAIGVITMHIFPTILMRDDDNGKYEYPVINDEEMAHERID